MLTPYHNFVIAVSAGLAPNHLKPVKSLFLMAAPNKCSIINELDLRPQRNETTTIKIRAIALVTGLAPRPCIRIGDPVFTSQVVIELICIGLAVTVLMSVVYVTVEWFVD